MQTLEQIRAAHQRAEDSTKGAGEWLADYAGDAHEHRGRLLLEIDQMKGGLEAAIRAAKLALFVIRKQGVMPNSSWESGFDGDLKTAEAAMARVVNQQRTAQEG